jgi:hypothetical protein
MGGGGEGEVVIVVRLPPARLMHISYYQRTLPDAPSAASPPPVVPLPLPPVEHSFFLRVDPPPPLRPSLFVSSSSLRLSLSDRLSALRSSSRGQTSPGQLLPPYISPR